MSTYTRQVFDDGHVPPHQEELGHMRRYIGCQDHMINEGVSAPEVLPHSEELGHMRRHITCEDHMQNEGVSVPNPVPHGYGRKKIIPRDHQVTRGDHRGDEEDTQWDARLQHGQGRKLIVPQDHLKSDVLKPIEEIAAVKVPTSSDMKDAIKDWLVTVHHMFVFDEAKWDSEVNVEPRGCHWVVEAFTQQKRSISREGPSARLIAEKLSMMPISELRYFGVRFAGRNDPQPVRRDMSATSKENRSLVSPGVHDALDQFGKPLGGTGGYPQQQTMSNTRKQPDSIHRRYISSGQDHWSHALVKGGDLPGSHGHSKDDDFSDGGLERGMGHGKRYIGTKDHLIGGGTVAER
jgi:hypothetical protein